MKEGALGWGDSETWVEFWCTCFLSGDLDLSFGLSKPPFLYLWNWVVMPILPSCHEYSIDNMLIVPLWLLLVVIVAIKHWILTDNSLPRVSYTTAPTIYKLNCPYKIPACLLNYCQIISTYVINPMKMVLLFALNSQQFLEKFFNEKKIIFSIDPNTYHFSCSWSFLQIWPFIWENVPLA